MIMFVNRLIALYFALLFTSWAYGAGLSHSESKHHFIYEFYHKVRSFYGDSDIRFIKKYFIGLDEEKCGSECKRKREEFLSGFIESVPGFKEYLEDFDYFLGYSPEEKSMASAVIYAAFSDGSNEKTFEYEMLRLYAAYNYQQRMFERAYGKGALCREGKPTYLGDIYTTSGSYIGWQDVKSDFFPIYVCEKTGSVMTYSLEARDWENLESRQIVALLRKNDRELSDSKAVEFLSNFIKSQ